MQATLQGLARLNGTITAALGLIALLYGAATFNVVSGCCQQNKPTSTPALCIQLACLASLMLGCPCADTSMVLILRPGRHPLAGPLYQHGTRLIL
jgi:hypothetical protein